MTRKFPTVPDLGRHKLPTSAQWKAACKARLAELREEGVYQYHVAEAIGCASAHITQTLHPDRQERSDIVRELSHALDVRMPEKARLMLRIDELPDDDPRLDSIGQLLSDPDQY